MDLCELTNIYIINKYLCLAQKHYYISIFILTILTIIIGSIILINKHSKNESGSKPSMIMEFFKILNEVFKGK